MIGRLPRPALVAGLVVAGLLALPAQSATAAPVESCAPSPKTPTSACLTYDLTVDKAGTTIPTRVTQEPVDVTISFQNSSTGFQADPGQSRWLTSLSANLMSGSDRTPLVQPSATLPDGLLVSGSSAPCGNKQNFTACTAGRGTGSAVMVDNPVGCEVCDVTFGIQRIENETADLGSSLVRLKVTLDACVNKQFLGLPAWQCYTGLTQTLDLGTVTQPKPLTLLAPNLPIASRTSLDSATIFLRGTSNQLADGTTTAQTHVTARLPMRCGPADAGGSATTVGGATVAVAKAYEVLQCAQLSVSKPASRLVYGASTSVNGTLTSYDRTPQGDFITWPMTDEPVLLRACPRTAVVPCSATPRTVRTDALGKFTFTLTPSVNVRYFVEYAGFDDEHIHLPGSFVPRDVSVAPAISRRVSRATMPSGGSVTLSGSVAPRHAGRVVNIQRYSGGTWRAIAKATLSSRSTYAKALTLRGTRGSTARLRVVLPEHADHLQGTSAAVSVRFG